MMMDFCETYSLCLVCLESPPTHGPRHFLFLGLAPTTCVLFIVAGCSLLHLLLSY